ncbi:MAG: tetratricopeptide repeat protein [Bryobacteraceae bacterium]
MALLQTKSVFQGLVLIGGVWLVPGVADAQMDLDPASIEHFQQGLQAQKAHQYGKATEEYREVVAKNPKFAEGYLNLGIVYQLQYRYDESVKALRQALATKPDLLPANVLLGISYYMLQDFESARKHLEKALAQNPRERNAGIYRALTLIGMDQTDEAARQLRHTGESYPNDIEISYDLGLAYSDGVKRSAQRLLESGRNTALYEWATGISADRKNETAGALVHYLKALQIDPNIPQLYLRAAALFESAGFPALAQEAAGRFSSNEARSDSAAVTPTATNEHQEKRDYLVLWSQLRQVQPDQSLPKIADTAINKLVREQMSLDQAGVLHAAVQAYEKRDFAGAEALLQTAAKAPANHWVYAYLLARCYTSQGDFEAAENVIEGPLAAASGIPSVVFLKLEVQSELALRCYDAVLSKKPESTAARILRAKSLAAANHPDEGIEEYRSVLASQPDLPGVHLGIAQIYADQLNWSGAIEELHKELDVNPENGLALALLGHACAESDQAEEAVPILTKVLARYPRDANALADLGKSFAQKGNSDIAIHYFERAVEYDPSRYKIHYRLFQLYQAAGRTELARKHLTAFQAEDAKHRADAVVIR